MTKKLYLLPCLLSLLALNPYIMPDTYDNLSYYLGARQFVTEGTLLHGILNGTGWPPGFPLMMAAPFALFGSSVLLGKLVVFACAVLSLLLAEKLLRLEKRPLILWSLCLFALAPLTFKYSTRLMTEIPFMMVSLLFLLQLKRMHSTAGAVLAGLLFGWAALTRYIGILLLLPLIAEGWQRRRKEEGIAAVVGLVLYGSWKVFVTWLERQTPGENGFTFHATPDHFLFFEPGIFLSTLSDFFLSTSFLMDNTGAILVGGVCLTLMLIGFWHQKWSSTDLYVWATLVLLSCFEWKWSRYYVPIGPFLFCYLLQGVAVIGRRLTHPLVWKGALGLWMLFFLTHDLLLLVRGNKSIYHGMNVLVSPTIKHYYAEKWRDLHDLSTFLSRETPPGPIYTSNIECDANYVSFFCERPVVWSDDQDDIAFFIMDETKPLEKPLPGTQCAQFGSYCVYHR